jgi:nitrate reductase gamma subunit
MMHVMLLMPSKHSITWNYVVVKFLLMLPMEEEVTQDSSQDRKFTVEQRIRDNLLHVQEILLQITTVAIMIGHLLMVITPVPMTRLVIATTEVVTMITTTRADIGGAEVVVVSDNLKSHSSESPDLVLCLAS